MLGRFHTDCTGTVSAIQWAKFRGSSSPSIPQREQEPLEGHVNSSEQNAEYKRYQALLSITSLYLCLNLFTGETGMFSSYTGTEGS